MRPLRVSILQTGSCGPDKDANVDRLVALADEAAASADLLVLPELCTTPYFAKVDNDAVLPRFSLTTAARVIEQHPELDNLGIEAIAHTVRTIEPRESVPETATRTYQKADWISGLGLYRTSQWRDSQPKAFDRWFGLENWMHERNSVCGWIDPAFPVFLLDRLPMPRFQALTAEYAAMGWQRFWPPYKAEQSALWDWCDEVKS